MQRVTITIDDDLVAKIDQLALNTGASNRSEVIRDLVRRGLPTQARDHVEAPCFGVISYAIDSTIRDLSRRIPKSRLERHDQTVAAISVPVDHHSSVDVVIMRGMVGAISQYAEGLFLERGVLHGNLSLVPLAEDHSSDHLPGSDKAHHVHLKVQETF
jgi:CopG family transcriptional regulator, nickel-responsive regulator